MFTIYKHFGDFFKCIFTILFKFSMKITFYLPLNNDKQKFVTFLEFFCRLHNLLLKFRLSKMSRNETPSWLRSQNSEYPMIFRVTRANQNARKLLFTDSVNTKIVYFVFFFLPLNPTSIRFPVPVPVPVAIPFPVLNSECLFPGFPDIHFKLSLMKVVR